MIIEMKVKFGTLDLSSRKFLVLLMDLENRSALPIWVGPLEATAIALGAEAPIFVEEDVLNRAKDPDLSDRLNDWLENLKPEDFKYKA